MRLPLVGVLPLLPEKIFFSLSLYYVITLRVKYLFYTRRCFVYMKGTVKFYHDRKNYGFIETDEMDDDIFFHKEETEDGMNAEEGTEVEFDQEEGDRGPKAANVVEA
jgi:CspA family cold shock protein